MSKQWSLNPVVLVPRCPEGKHGHLQNMAMNETARGSLGREERERDREVVIVSQNLLHTHLLLFLLLFSHF